MTYLARSARQIGTVILRVRRAAGLTQSDVADRLGIRQATISSVEAGAEGTKLSTLLDILAALDLELTIAPRSSGADTAIEDIF
jgi:HTH-type transcriptional regulator/antitoxin HipB